MGSGQGQAWYWRHNHLQAGDFGVHGGNVEGMVFVFVWWLGLVSKVGLGGII